MDIVAAPTSVAPATGLAPFSLRETPALIERIFPAQKVGIETQGERKAGTAQTLTALGSYWCGRKPLILVRAALLASLLPATNDPEADLEIFDLLMRFDDEGLWRRQPEVSVADICNSPAIEGGEKAALIETPEHYEGSPVVAAKWRKIDLRVFDDELKLAHKAARQKIQAAKKSSSSPDEQQKVVSAIEAEGDAEQRMIVARREAARAAIHEARQGLKRRALVAMPFAAQVAACKRVELVEDLTDSDDPLYRGIWDRVNGHLRTQARTLPGLLRELGTARFGRPAVIGDPFCGGGSIPFEAARLGCEVVASDLNPVAVMLTWGAINILGAAPEVRERISAEQRRVAESVDAEITRLGFEHDRLGNHAKAYLYCLEVVDLQSGWRVPMLPSLVISVSRRCVCRLVPNPSRKRFEMEVVTGASDAEMAEAERGTVRDKHLTYSIAPLADGEMRPYRTPLSLLRGDQRGGGNDLRQWDTSDIAPREPAWDPDAAPVVAGAPAGAWIGGDILLERLYAIQWIDGADLRQGKPRPRTWFDAPGKEDLERESMVLDYVRERLEDWQLRGLVPDMRIEPGEKTDEPIRTRGWTHWHHLFTPRGLLTMAVISAEAAKSSDHTAFMAVITECADWQSRLCRWETSQPRATGGAMDGPHSTFYNQAINTFMNYCLPSSIGLMPVLRQARYSTNPGSHVSLSVKPVVELCETAAIWIYDPPYADAVHYHEITEFFIAWLKKHPPAPFDRWRWDSRRPLAIQGKGDKFRSDMVEALGKMADCMPDNGLQVCMFTHKDAGVWADMAGIVWAAGLRVTAAWYVSTETTSDLKKGGYVQGTVLLVLRKRGGGEYGYRSDIVPEVRARVAAQVRMLTGLNQTRLGSGRDENLFSDSDIQMAGYAAALEVLTVYTHIDGIDMTREALRPREASRQDGPATIGIVEEMISLAVQTANEIMIPDGFPEALWERLRPTERFYLKMTAIEAVWPTGATGGKLDDYQNFAKAYRADGTEELMADSAPGRARLKSASEFRSTLLQDHPISAGPLRPTLYAVMCLAQDATAEADPEDSGAQALHGLRDRFGGEWLRVRDNVRTLATWLGRTWDRRHPQEGSAARVLAALIGSEKLR
ncbi:MAG: anti-phage-associated DUF1156 domain-containing protein [Rhodopila sp.]